MQENWQILLKQGIKNQYVEKSQEWVDVNISTSGLLNLTIVSDRFIGLSISQRQEQISNLLKSQVPHLSPGFLSLYTPEEAKSLNLSPPEVSDVNTIKTWQDLAIQAANPQNQLTFPQRELSLPRTVTFYSFKGGVGRTTALTHVAWILAMGGRKVVAVDLDLEAPGLSTAFNLQPQPKYGIVDYFYERSYLPEGIKASISITEIFGEVRIPNAKGRLFVVPAGCLSLDYIAKVDDLHANTIIDGDQNLWSVFKCEIDEQLKPDVILIDSRTGINQWGALSLIQAADDAVIFLFPNEQNKQGIKLLLQSLQNLNKLSINFVFSPVPDVSKLDKVKEIYQSLLDEIKISTDEESEIDDNDQLEIPEPLVIPYLQPIALADNYPVRALLDYYNKIVNLIDEETDEIERTNILTNSETRWKIIESLQFPEVNAADTDKKQNFNLLFQRTNDFEKFLDHATCLIRGRKGTGKTALYWFFLKYKSDAQKLAHGRLDNTVFLSAHGRYQESRPTRDEFQIIHQHLQNNSGTWEAFWRAYLLLRCYQEKLFIFPKGRKSEKFTTIKSIFTNLHPEIWQSENTSALLELSTNSELRLIVKDAINIIIHEEAKNKSQKIWFLYDDLDEDFPEAGEVRQSALSGLFQLVQSCDANRLTEIRFKIFLREDIWNRLIFDNKSHFTGRDIILQWTRVDFLRLALRQSIQSPDFKNLVDRFSPIAVESIDQSSEDAIDKALELLWGSRRRTGNKAKYVSRWAYERLTDSSGTTFPRSLSILLTGAKEQELSYQGKSSIQPPTDRLLRSKSLEIGLKKASEKRCDEIKNEYSHLIKFFDSLKQKSALLPKEELHSIWQESAQDIADFEEFTSFLTEIGIIEWRERDKRYKFADIYVYGFKMDRSGAV
ncbi:AAA family ATPase [Aphanizomenon flos-aquae NRERC-008]|jgi:MinD-like ATPase involved in chromosome partitioning or flagellar assembly/stress-induced morphogen|uniref:AAA family ATPase n=1 Tax=Aphanizomenon flos-aquae FACHB-1249 TaxID=2692889 RepID=A0ABR8IVN7_APHFL|nr:MULTISPECIES: AAA family ATPase [Aphanizomenon]MCE2906696.1 AAA family ATPase [Anabaena sp. CoA2_C59]MDJ0504279.1 AAA family ATPase [Nostocales cyanobacterium LE14-WE12]MBD2392546.1 AAA family ATPase [Aphanizomenon flos-aquae FACHB-1171]MBD2558817.1 AAA family ATPase [Aphanizomenon flos-aquae FACHB-1290]MBD2630350.1 AAA family ATPase [Aphanizomenon sp. FACHB-1399]